MKVVIREVPESVEEQVIIECYRISEEVKDIRQFVRLRGVVIDGYSQGAKVPIPISDIFYIESVDDRVYVYLSEGVYEIRQRLYEIENQNLGTEFFRCSKQTIINLLKIVDIKPSMNGRFVAVLTNGEKVMISRKYVPELIKKLKGVSL